ncbi:MAG: ATP-dependent DNA helicase RecQ [Deltaproteobacteria bacterium]|nr:ATP-dependent DNA helicase RecQ [Deltaproteobacteria bacterium]
MTDLLQALRTTFGYPGFREGQEEVVRAVATGHDCLVVMPTGAGKSLCYQLPALVRPGTALVVSPLIALMKDQVDALQRKGVAATCIHSGLTDEERRERTEAIAAWRIVYVAPERFHERFLARLRRVTLSLFAVDEAHCLSEWGRDFRPEYLRLGEVRAALDRPPTVALTASATPEVQEDVLRVLGIEGCRRFIRGFDRKNLIFEAVSCPTPQAKIERLRAAVAPGPTLVYCATRRNVERVTRALRDSGIRAGFYHGGLDAMDRVRVHEAFMEGRIPVVVATNAFGMGVDKADVRCVIHHDVPGSVEAYYQEIGRAGRDGEPARALLLFRPEDRRIHEFFIRQAHPAAARVEAIWTALAAAARIEGSSVEVRRSDLAAALPEGAADEGAVEGCLAVLEREGRIRRGPSKDRPAGLRLRPGPPLPGLEGRVLAALEDRLTDLPGGALEIRPAGMCEALGLDPDRLEAALGGLERRGRVVRGGGGRVERLEVLDPDRPLHLDVEVLERSRRRAMDRLDRMMDYIHAPCRRRFLLDHFGETPDWERCGTCDACRSGATLGAPRPLTPEQTVIVRRVLACLAQLGQGRSKRLAASVLTGSEERAVRVLGLDRHPSWGALGHWTRGDVEALLNALVLAGLLSRRTVEGRAGGRDRTWETLDLTDLGRRFLEGQRGDLRMHFPGARPASDRPTGAVPPSGTGRDLLEHLKSVRRAAAAAADVPAYVVAPDRTLTWLAVRRPVTREEFLEAPGMGPVRFRRYGTVLLDALRAWTGTVGPVRG